MINNRNIAKKKHNANRYILSLFRYFIQGGLRLSLKKEATT